MKFAAFIIAIVFSFASFADIISVSTPSDPATNDLDQSSSSPSNQVVAPIPSKQTNATPQLHNDFYVTQPWPPMTNDTLKDFKILWSEFEVLPTTLGSNAKTTLKNIFKDYIAAPIDEGIRLANRYFDISQPKEIYQRSGILPDDILVVSIKSFPINIELPPQDGPYKAVLQLNIKRASGKQFYGLRTRPVGTPNLVYLATSPGEIEGEELANYLQGPSIVPLTYIKRSIVNNTNKLIFELRGTDFYNALKGLRFNYRKYDKYYFSLAIIGNEKGRFIYDTFEIPLNANDIVVETVQRGLGGDEPAVVAQYAQDQRMANQTINNAAIASVRQELQQSKQDLQSMRRDFGQYLGQLQQQVTALDEQYTSLDNAMIDLQQLINDSGKADEKLRQQFDELQKNMQELRDRMTILQGILLTAEKVSSVSPEEDEE